MLLNLSNHPSKAWPGEQLEQASAHYGQVSDMPFPSIHPEWDTPAVYQLASEYADTIATMEPRPKAVHIMGEMTFTCALVDLLRKQAIPCIASTTRRDAVENNGIKTSVFRFVRFRPY